MIRIMDSLERAGMKSKDAMHILLRRAVYIPFHSIETPENVFKAIMRYGLWSCSNDYLLESIRDELVRSNQSIVISLGFVSTIVFKLDAW
jgi:hypothetical protein